MWKWAGVVEGGDLGHGVREVEAQSSASLPIELAQIRHPRGEQGQGADEAGRRPGSVNRYRDRHRDEGHATGPHLLPCSEVHRKAGLLGRRGRRQLAAIGGWGLGGWFGGGCGRGCGGGCGGGCAGGRGRDVRIRGGEGDAALGDLLGGPFDNEAVRDEAHLVEVILWVHDGLEESVRAPDDALVGVGEPDLDEVVADDVTHDAGPSHN